MAQISNEQVITDESTQSKIQHFKFPTVYKECYQIEMITNDKQSYSTDTENPTALLYQLLDSILLDKYSNFHGGVQAASAATTSTQAQAHSKMEPWEDVSDMFARKTNIGSLSILQSLVDNEDTEQEEEKSNPTSKDILVSRLKNILIPRWLTYRLGCVNNRIYAFPQPDGSINFDIMPRSDSDKVVHEIHEKRYKDSINTFIELIIKAIDEDNIDGEFSIHMAANLSADAVDTERDEFLAIVTPNNKTIIMMGFFYYRFYG